MILLVWFPSKWEIQYPSTISTSLETKTETWDGFASQLLKTSWKTKMQ